MLVADRASCELFEETVALGAPAQKAANWVTQDVAALLNKRTEDAPGIAVTPRQLADLIDLIDRDAISGQGAKQALEDAFETGDAIDAIVERRGLAQVSDAGALGAVADEVIAEHPDVVAQFKAGKEGVVGFLVGQVMKRSGGAANPKLAQELLRERLSS